MKPVSPELTPEILVIVVEKVTSQSWKCWGVFERAWEQHVWNWGFRRGKGETQLKKAGTRLWSLAFLPSTSREVTAKEEQQTDYFANWSLIIQDPDSLPEGERHRILFNIALGQWFSEWNLLTSGIPCYYFRESARSNYFHNNKKISLSSLLY